MITRRAVILAVIALLLSPLLITSAEACPVRTVFSARNGNGLCLVAGQGLTIAARCTVAQGGCPSGTQRKHSNQDPSRDYCCPMVASNLGAKVCVWRGTGPICKGSCERGEVYDGYSTNGCITGGKFRCCNRP